MRQKRGSVGRTVKVTPLRVAVTRQDASLPALAETALLKSEDILTDVMNRRRFCVRLYQHELAGNEDAVDLLRRDEIWLTGLQCEVAALHAKVQQLQYSAQRFAPLGIGEGE